jgi:hypothetical protein
MMGGGSGGFRVIFSYICSIIHSNQIRGYLPQAIPVPPQDM